MQLPLPEAVLWDMDGTMIDQTVGIVRCFREVITGFGHDEPDPDAIRRSLGGPMASTMERFVDDSELDEACRRFRARFPEIMLDGLVILPGALELIHQFHQRGIPQAIFTNKHGDTARAVSAHCGFAERIPVCIGNKDTEWSKPDPQLTRHVLAQINAVDRAAILIGDSPTDAATARNAGLPCYSVATGAHSVAELQEAGATAFASLEELQKAFGITP